jgi:hypothetical protein
MCSYRCSTAHSKISFALVLTILCFVHLKVIVAEIRRKIIKPPPDVMASLPTCSDDGFERLGNLKWMRVGVRSHFQK